MQRKSLTCTAEHKRSDNSLAPLKTLKVIYFLRISQVRGAECNCEHAADSLLT